MKGTDEITQKSELAGFNENGTWFKNRNCVYFHKKNGYRLRVAIKTKTGWKNYGYFNSLGAATYVANIAILLEDSEVHYELNEFLSMKKIVRNSMLGDQDQAIGIKNQEQEIYFSNEKVIINDG